MVMTCIHLPPADHAGKGMSRSEPLNIKDAQSFKLALSLYEKKQYEKALQEVESINKRRKEHEHGESLCLQGLILHNLDPRKNEDTARALLLRGSELDSGSHVAWHMRGIFHKLRREYPDALNAYLRSFRLYPENPNTWQDLAMAAAQQGDFATLVEVRQHSLAQRPNVRMNWVALVAALYLAGNYTGVERTIDLYFQLQAGEAPKEKRPLDEQLENDEMKLVRNLAILKRGEYKRALKEAKALKVRDERAALEQQAEALLELYKDNKSFATEAKEVLLQLLTRNPDNAKYYDQLDTVVLGPHPTESQVFEHYDSLASKFPKADLPQSRPLFLLSPSGDGKYKQRLREYLEKQIARGVPNIFMLVKELYSNPEKRAVLCEVVEGLLNPGKSLPVEGTVGTLFLACHFSHTGRQTMAVSILEGAIGNCKDNELLVDFKLVMAELQQRAGAKREAAYLLRQLSKENEGDRYINTKASRAFFAAGDPAEGYRLAFMFPREGKHAETDAECMKFLNQMDSVDVLLNAAKSHYLAREHSLALKRALEVIKVFHNYHDEQYDFHFYGPKRGTLRQYIAMVEWGKSLFGRKTYVQAVELAAHILAGRVLHLPGLVSAKEDPSAKKQRAKQLANFTDKDLEADSDPFGVGALENTTKSLQQVFDEWKLADSAIGNDHASAQFLLTGFKLLLAQGKHVLALKTLSTAASAANSSKSLIHAHIALARYAIDKDESVPAPVRMLANGLLTKLVGERAMKLPVAEFINEFVGNLNDWASARVYVNQTEDVEAQCTARLPELDLFEQVEELSQVLTVAEIGAKFNAEASRAWPIGDLPN